VYFEFFTKKCKYKIYSYESYCVIIIFRDSPGFTLNELNLHSHQVKSFRSKKHSIVHWTLSLTPEFVLKTSKLVT
jgi:hypothetical protein